MNLSSLSDYELLNVINNEMDMEDIASLSKTNRRFRDIVLNQIPSFRKWFDRKGLPYPSGLRDPRDIITSFFILQDMKKNNYPYPNPIPVQIDTLNAVKNIFLVGKAINNAVEKADQTIIKESAKRVVRHVDNVKVSSRRKFTFFYYDIYLVRFNELTPQIKDKLSFMVNWAKVENDLRGVLAHDGNVRPNENFANLPDDYALSIEFQLSWVDNKPILEIAVLIDSVGSKDAVQFYKDSGNHYKLHEYIMKLYYLDHLHTVDFFSKSGYDVVAIA